MSQLSTVCGILLPPGSTLCYVSAYRYLRRTTVRLVSQGQCETLHHPVPLPHCPELPPAAPASQLLPHCPHAFASWYDNPFPSTPTLKPFLPHSYWTFWQGHYWLSLPREYHPCTIAFVLQKGRCVFFFFKRWFQHLLHNQIQTMGCTPSHLSCWTPNWEDWGTTGAPSASPQGC